MGFTIIYGCGSHLVHLTQISQTFVLPTHGCSTCNLALIGQAVLEMFEIMATYINIAQEQGQTTPLVIFYINLVSLWLFAVTFSH